MLNGGRAGAVRSFSPPARILQRYCTSASYGASTRRMVGDMCNGIDIVELYRKTSAAPDITVTAEELRMMESEILPYSVW